MQIIAKNQVFEPAINAHEGLSVHYKPNGFQIYFTLSQPQASEIEMVEEGELNFSAAKFGDLVLLSIKTGDAPWIDSPIVFDTPFSSTELADDEGIMLTFLLLDVPSGIVKGMRICALPHEFSVDLQEMLKACKPLSTDEVFRQVDKIYAQHSIEQLLTKEDSIKGKVAGIVRKFK